MVVFRKKNLFSGKTGVIRAKWLYSGIFLLFSGKSDCVQAKIVLFGQKWLHSGKVVVFGKTWV